MAAHEYAVEGRCVFCETAICEACGTCECGGCECSCAVCEDLGYIGCLCGQYVKTDWFKRAGRVPSGTCLPPLEFTDPFSDI